MERKTFLRGALGVAALSISGCAKNDKRRIAVVPKGRAHLFWQSVHAGAVKAAFGSPEQAWFAEAIRELGARRG